MFLAAVFGTACGETARELSIWEGRWKLTSISTNTNCGVVEDEDSLGWVNINHVSDYYGNKVLFRDFEWDVPGVATPHFDAVVAWNEGLGIFGGSTWALVPFSGTAETCERAVEMDYSGSSTNESSFEAQTNVTVHTEDGNCSYTSNIVGEHNGW